MNLMNDNVFTNQDEVEENIDRDFKSVTGRDRKKGPMYYAKRNCKRCYGKGGFPLLTPAGESKILVCKCVVMGE